MTYCQYAELPTEGFEEARQMRTLMLLAVFAASITVVVPAPVQAQVHVYKENEFVVSYPNGLFPVESTVGVRFVTRDRSVAFFAFSSWMMPEGFVKPWLPSGSEVLVKKSSANGREYGYLRGPDYWTQYVEVNDAVSQWRAFSFTYSTAEEYRKWKPAYDKFVASFKAIGGVDP